MQLSRRPAVNHAFTTLGGDFRVAVGARHNQLSILCSWCMGVLPFVTVLKHLWKMLLGAWRRITGDGLGETTGIN